MRPRSGKRLADLLAGRRVSRPTPAAVAQHTGPTCRPPGAQSRLPGPLTRTEPAGPPSTPPRALDRPGPAVTSDKMFPATTRSRGPAQHPSAQTLARPGPGPAPDKFHTCTSTGLSRLQLAADPRAESTAARTQQKLSSTNRSVSSAPYLHEQRWSDIDRSQIFNPTPFDNSRSYPSPTLDSAGVHST